jgi:hypothetical protein
MAKAPDQRFDTVMEFANALSAAAAPPPLSLSSGNATPRQTSDPSGLGSERPVHSITESAGKGGQPRALSPVPGTSPQLRLLRALEEAKNARSIRDIDLAAKLVERAMGIVDVHGSREALAALEREEALIEGTLEMRLGDRARPLRLLRQPEVRASLLPEEAFLLSRIDGVVSAEEVLDLSPMPRLRTLRLLVRMLRYKLITNE